MLAGRLLRVMTAMTIAAVALAVTATPALAADVRAGDTITLSQDDQVDGDLYMAGRVVSSNAVVLGDIFAAGETLQIGGSVDGGLSAAGESIVIDGIIARGARTAGSTVQLTGRVDRDLLVGSSVFTLESGGAVGQDLYFGAGTVVIRGDIGGDVRGGAQELIIEGNVGGDVNVEVGTLVIMPGATIGGDLIYTGRDEASIPADVVQGEITFSQRSDIRIRNGAFRHFEALTPLAVFTSIIWKVSWYLMALLTGIVLILLTPRRMSGTATAPRTDIGPVAGWGAIALFVTPIAAVVLCLTLIGLPLGVITLLLWGILLYLAQLPVSLFIGHVIIGYRKPLEGKGFMIGALALGLLILTLLRSIPLLGFLVSLTTALFGLGAMVVFERRLAQSRRSSPDGATV